MSKQNISGKTKRTTNQFKTGKIKRFRNLKLNPISISLKWNVRSIVSTPLRFFIQASTSYVYIPSHLHFVAAEGLWKENTNQIKLNYYRDYTLLLTCGGDENELISLNFIYISSSLLSCSIIPGGFPSRRTLFHILFSPNFHTNKKKTLFNIRIFNRPFVRHDCVVYRLSFLIAFVASRSFSNFSLKHFPHLIRFAGENILSP